MKQVKTNLNLWIKSLWSWRIKYPKKLMGPKQPINPEMLLGVVELKQHHLLSSAVKYLNLISKDWKKSKNLKIGILTLLSWKIQLSILGKELDKLRRITINWILSIVKNRQPRIISSIWMRSWIKLWKELISRSQKLKINISRKWVKNAIIAITILKSLWI